MSRSRNSPVDISIRPAADVLSNNVYTKLSATYTSFTTPFLDSNPPEISCVSVNAPFKLKLFTYMYPETEAIVVTSPIGLPLTACKDDGLADVVSLVYLS